jgi:hypothetical protein
MNKIKCFLLLFISINTISSCGVKKTKNPCDAYHTGNPHQKKKQK